METLAISEDLSKSLKILTIIVAFTENIWDFSVAMKQSENRIYSMILLRKWNINKSHWLHTLQIYTVWKPPVEISHTHGNILKSRVFTDFFYKEILTCLISFSPRNTFLLNLLLKASIVYAKVFMISSLWTTVSVRDTSDTSEFESIT